MTFRFHQALFGYDRGHQLLAASTQLSTETRHRLAVATDLSGSPPRKGFERCFTGLPAAGSDYYALFCTWLAPEMARPGCVWSHVLLIDLVDLGRLHDLVGVRVLFSRPAKAEKLDGYLLPVSYTENPDVSVDVLPEMAEILSSLYETNDESILIADADSRPHEEGLFALWSQQWPRLRRNFRFSTGSFGDRGRGGSRFDIQITPSSSLNAWHRADGNELLNSGKLKRAEPPQKWLEEALDDLRRPDCRGLRSFLRKYGADVSDPRKAFRKLLNVFVDGAFRRGVSSVELLRTIAAAFPNPIDAGTLKEASISLVLGTNTSGSSRPLIDIIRFLCHEDGGAFSNVEFDFDRVIPDVWRTLRDDLINVLGDRPRDDVRWTRMAIAVAASIEGRDLAWLWSEHPGLLLPFLRLKPSLLETVELWKLPERAQWRIAEIVDGRSLSDDTWLKIVKALIASGTTIPVHQVVRSVGLDILKVIIECLDKGTESIFYGAWREALRPYAESYLDGGRILSAAEFILSASLASSVSFSRLDAGRTEAQSLSKVSLSELPEPLRTRAAFVLLVLGLRSGSKLGGPLIAIGFFRVHEALGSSSEPPEMWAILSQCLPDVWIWEEWDRCKRLERAIEKWLKKNPRAYNIVHDGARNREERKLLEKLI